jgi:hypothetical protein
MGNAARDFAHCANAQKANSTPVAPAATPAPTPTPIVGICHAPPQTTSSQSTWVPTWKQSTTIWNGAYLGAPDGQLIKPLFK